MPSKHDTLNQRWDSVADGGPILDHIRSTSGIFWVVWGCLASVIKPFDLHDLLHHICATYFDLKGLAHAKIIKKSVILFRVLNMTI